jgi:hypothetical protein
MPQHTGEQGQGSQSGLAVEMNASAEPGQFLNMHETIFKYRFGNNAHTVSDGVHSNKLSLHIRWEGRVWRSAKRNRFRFFTVHIQLNPVFACSDFSARFG